jgi:endonuclease IV
MNILFQNYGIKIGLKLWSVNTDLIAHAERLHRAGYFQYVELYSVPGTCDKVINQWKKCPVPYVIHCAHSSHGFNLAKKDMWIRNQGIFQETQRFADMLNADAIILHGGHDGDIDEVIRQMAELWDERMFIENKPQLGLNNRVCIGWSVQEIQKIRKSAKVSGMCLDFAHAVCAANAAGQDPDELIDGFFSLKPSMFHLSDGDRHSQKDKHRNFGQGNFEVRKWIAKIPAGARLAIETPMGSGSGLDYFKNDVSYLNELYSKQVTSE